MEGADPEPLLEYPRYIKVQTLGKGAFGFVQQARDVQNNDQVAIKFLSRGDHVNKYVERELLVHRLLRHPHVIQFREVFLTSSYLCIAMEYASGGTLFGFVQRAVRLKEVVARWFFQQLILGVDYCHRRGVVNRDIKLENTLLDYVPGLPLPLIKICDFGYSKADFMSDPKSRVGTPVYMAPEVILASAGTYDGKLADIWSCGVMLYVMLVGQYPFDSNRWREVTRANISPEAARRMLSEIMLSIPPDVDMSPECRELLMRMLTGEPRRRINMQGILEHPFFRKNLPQEAQNMNEQYLLENRASGFQTEEDIKAILRAARTPGPRRQADDDLAGIDDDQIIDGEISEDFRNERHRTQEYRNWQAQQQQQQQQAQHHQQQVQH